MMAAEAVEAFNLLMRRWHGLSKIEDDHERMMATYEVRHAWEPRVADLLNHAEEGGPDLWHALGSAFQWGHGVERDISAAELWYERAALAGKVRSMVALGLCKQQSESRSERETAVSWLRKGADLGDGASMMFLGFAYREGKGVEKDYEQAITWFLKAVEAGQHSALIRAAGVYDDYLKMPERALPLLRRAAELGLTESHGRLASILERRGTPVSDPIEAASWYEKVAEAGGCSAPRAMMAMAQLARSGNGRPPDPETARKWLTRLCESVPEKWPLHKRATELLRGMDGELF
jgi:TPR repeat protein